jgi:hypothetical protein
MKYNNYIYGILLIAIPLILLILCHRHNAYKYCNNDMQCLKDKLIYNLNEFGKKIDNNPQIQENFFGGLGNWFSGSNPPPLPISPGSLPNENLNILQKKLNDNTQKSASFPPNGDDFKDSDNNDMLKSLGAKPFLKNPVMPMPNTENKDPVAIYNKQMPIKPPTINIPKPDVKSLLGNCQFYNDKCPEGYHPLGNFSIGGVSNGLTLSCGNVQNVKPASAIAIIKNNNVYEIHITDKGHGYNPITPPKVIIEGGKGNGATAEALIDENGFIKSIRVINPGYNYSETPRVLVDPPYMNSSCHLCCKND